MESDGLEMKLKSPRYSPVAVKICGITRLEDAKLAVENGADALGFNFCPDSPRKISVSQARGIISRLPRRVTAVGVFVNMPAPEVLRIARTAKLGAVQLHGEESPEAVARLAKHFPVIKALRVRPSFRMSHLAKYSAATAFLLDGFDRHLRGGTGRTFHWKLARQKKRPPLILAGGLTKQNVRSAIRAAKPSAVDVCSGVERSPGRKDPQKIRDFFAAIAVSRGKAK